MTNGSNHIHSRGSGRSGPKRKTGCSTCRKRKVRCHENRPICANCVRLRLRCGYMDEVSRYPTGSRGPTSVGDSHQEESIIVTPAITSNTGAPYFDDGSGFGPQQSQQHLPPSHQHGQPSQTLGYSDDLLGTWDFGALPASAIASPFQDIFFSSIDDLHVDGDFQNQVPFSGTLDLLDQTAPTQQQQVASGDGFTNDENQRFLLDHFIKSANPISVILPNFTEWASACRSLLTMAKDCLCLSSAIYALSALHIYTSEKRDTLDQALMYYRTSSSEVNMLLDQDIDDRRLKQAFATIFLLSHVEIMAQSTPNAKEWPLSHVQTAHKRVLQFSERLRTWTSISRRLLTWMTLLQTKAEYNGGMPKEHLASLEQSTSAISKPATNPPNSSALITSPSQSAVTPHTNTQHTHDLAVDDTRTTAELAYDTINAPAFDFYLSAQAFTNRIIALDPYHRPTPIPGPTTLAADYELLQRGHAISTALHELWAARPATVAFLSDPAGLADVFQPRIASRLRENLRVYVATYYAQFIYLHRVAFERYPATQDVQDAVAEILCLAKQAVAEMDDEGTRESGGSSGQAADASDKEGRTALPATMLWPLFLAGLECGLEERSWVLSAMRGMQDVSSARGTAMLLEEVLRRQDESGRRVDHRSVRREVFESELSVLY